MEVILKREELYKDVWSRPMRTIAKDYNISDVGLRKICIKLNIPLPGAGYWRKIEVGQTVKQTPLPPMKSGGISEYKFFKTEPEHEKPKPKVVLPIEMENKISEIDNDANKIIVKEVLGNIHPLVQNTASALSKAKEDKGLLSYYSEKPTLDVRIGPKSVHRVLLIMDAFIKFLEKHGFAVSCEKRTTIVKIFDEPIEIILREFNKRIPTNKKNSWGNNIYDFIPSGELTLYVYESSYLTPKGIKDTKNSKIEEKLNDFVKTLIMTSYSRKQHRIWQKEQERKQILDWQAEQEARRLKELEDKRATDLLAIIDLWNRSKLIREFINHYKDVITNSNYSPEDIAKIEEWITWAKKYADKIDPLQKKQMLRHKSW